MKNRTWMAVVAGCGALAGLLAFSGIVTAEQGENEVTNGTIRVERHTEADFPSLATVTAGEAEQKALEAVPGTLLKTELEDENGFLVYGIEVVTPEKAIKEVKVDAGSGEVLHVEMDTPDDEEAGEDDEAGEADERSERLNG